MQKIRDAFYTVFMWWVIRRSKMFDAAYYRTQNKDVADSVCPALWHYLIHGAAEGRDPSPDFNTSFYLNRYPEVRDSGMNPLFHYIRHGKGEGRVTNRNAEKALTNLAISKRLTSSVISDCDSAVLILDHGMGGGTSKYLYGNLINPSDPIPKTLLVHYDRSLSSFIVQVRRKTEVIVDTSYEDWKTCIADIGKINYSSIIVNSLVFWPSAETALAWISEYKSTNPAVKVEYKGHDFYCVCPSYTLQDHKHRYCGIRCDETACNECVRKQGAYHCFLDGDNCKKFSVSHWRKIWNTFFTDTADVFEVFSPSSRDIFLQAYPDLLPKIRLTPHKIRSFDCCNIAVLGYLSIHKGSEVIRSFCEYLDENQTDDLQLYLFGSNPEAISSPHLTDMGYYERKDLPEKLKKTRIDAVFIPSTWPETFCYTAGESIALGYPTACFDLGGQADQVKASGNGVILYEDSPEYLYTTLKALRNNSADSKTDVPAAAPEASTKTVVLQDYASRDFLHWMYSLRDDKSHFVPEAKDSIVMTETMPKIIASYLPQFHDFPENIQWFGRGFNEWTNTSQTLPQFIGHRQPHVPIDVGYYNLNSAEIMYRQAELAKKYGIFGFCVYYYWFSGVKLMDQPLKRLLENKDLDFPFFLFWANDDWTMAWGNGATHETLYKGRTLPGEAEAFMADVLPYMRDARYIRINNKPVLLIYRISLAKKSDYREFVSKIQAIAQREGFDGLYLISPIEDFMDPDRLEDVRKEYKLDALMEFHPIAGRKGWNLKQEKFADPACRSLCYDVDDYILNQKYLRNTNAKIFPGLFPDWDNSPRRYNRGAWILQNTPENYKKWLSDLIRWSREHNTPDEQFIFVNAWNEWAEGAHLEPDTYYGYAYLQKTREALEESEEG